MHRPYVVMTTVALSLCSVLHVSAQQDNGEYAIEDSFPFAAGCAVASDKSADDEDQRIFVGSGGGIFTLDGSNYQPIADEAGTPSDFRLRADGQVRAIRLLGDKVYVAAREGGLQRFDRGDHGREFKYLLGKVEPGAWSLDVVGIGTDLTWALVGSNDDDVGGRLYIVQIDDSVNPNDPTISLEHEIDLGSPVFSVEATTTLVQGKVTVFIGTACPLSPACNSLYRYDIDPSSNSAPVPGASWPQECDIDASVRDIVLDEGAAGGARAYVAANTHGLRAFDVSDEATMTEITTNGWPILNPNGGGHGIFRYADLDHYAPENLLVASLAATLNQEVQGWGTCSDVVECDVDPPPEQNQLGLVVFDLDDQMVNEKEFALGVGGTSSDLPHFPVDFAVREREGSEFLIDVSCFPFPLAVVKVDLIGHPAISRVGNWNENNQPSWGPPAPGGGFDDVSRLGDVLYVTTEGTLLTFDLSGSPQAALGDFAALETDGAVLMNRMSDTLAANPSTVSVLYSRDFVTGIRFFNIANPLQPEASTGYINRPNGLNGRGYCCYAIEALGTTAGTRWLYSADLTDFTSETDPTHCNPVLVGYTPVPNGSIRVFQVDEATEPSSTTTPLLGAYVPSGCPLYASEHGQFMDVVATPTENNTHAVWATYGPRGLEFGSGLLVLEATLNESAVSFEFVRKVEFLSEHVGGAISRLTYVAQDDALYASYGCGGVVRYDVANPLDPLETGRYEFVPLPGETHNPPSLQVYPAVPPYVYVSLMSGGVGILDSTDMDAGWQLGSPFDTGCQPNCFWDAPEESGFDDGSAVWVAEAAGGINRLQFKVFP